jgi:hypothetical protein
VACVRLLAAVNPEAVEMQTGRGRTAAGSAAALGEGQREARVHSRSAVRGRARCGGLQEELALRVYAQGAAKLRSRSTRLRRWGLRGRS